MPQIIRARLPRDTDKVRTLWLAYEDYLHSIDCHDCGGETIAPELQDLAGYYPNQDASIFLLNDKETPVGTIAFNRFDKNTAELRRLYVLPAYEGKSYGRALMEQATQAAKNFGYSRLLLDTFKSQQKPVGLYKKLGFSECAAYNDSPKHKTLFMEKTI